MMTKVMKILKGLGIVVGVAFIGWLIFSNVSKSKKLENLENRLNESQSSEISTEEGEETKGTTGEITNEEIRAGLAEVTKTVNYLSEKLNAVEEKANSVKTDDIYLDVKFPHDGYFYKDARETQFYSDPTCTVKISNVRFISSNVDNSQAENGLYIFCLRMDNGQICYCTESPYLITEEAYKEYTANK